MHLVALSYAPLLHLQVSSGISSVVPSLPLDEYNAHVACTRRRKRTSHETDGRKVVKPCEYLTLRVFCVTLGSRWLELTALGRIRVGSWSILTPSSGPFADLHVVLPSPLLTFPSSGFQVHLKSGNIDRVESGLRTRYQRSRVRRNRGILGGVCSRGS